MVIVLTLLLTVHVITTQGNTLNHKTTSVIMLRNVSMWEHMLYLCFSVESVFI